ncbi:mannose-1-phosphate guanylyltransferase/mannose-6-phosphate isomerase, partial [Litorivicinus sp.]|nr:mannose-1-phosphate guanylyltransferase/mannose-6-phosphate isomerase [Litorivicinus sp.]
VCNNDHRFLVADQLSQVGTNVAKIILEPVARNTAPAIALAAIEALKISPNAQLLVLTADHVIPDTAYFCELIEKALLSNQPMMTFGVTPTRPETGYGYIETGDMVGATGVMNVKKFVEKPDTSVAEVYLNDGGFLWNSGIFLLDARVYLNELSTLSGEIFAACESAMSKAIVDLDFIRVDEGAFKDCPSESVDVAVMERSKKLTIMPFESAWSDLGAWDSVMNEMANDVDGNVIVGDALAFKTTNSLIRSERRLVAAVGVDNLLITETADVVLVASRESAQDVKCIVEFLRSDGRCEAEEHVIGYRPWGFYESVIQGERFQVKRIVVSPGKSLSLQMHHYRSEHWIVVEGTAEIVNGEEALLLSENESTYIPVGVRHRLKNPGKVDLVLIEVQSGSYLGEDDIVRFDDEFGRVLKNSL